MASAPPPLLARPTTTQAPLTRVQAEAFVDRAVDQGFSDEEIQEILAERGIAPPAALPTLAQAPPALQPQPPLTPLPAPPAIEPGRLTLGPRSRAARTRDHAALAARLEEGIPTLLAPALVTGQAVGSIVNSIDELLLDLARQPDVVTQSILIPESAAAPQHRLDRERLLPGTRAVLPLISVEGILGFLGSVANLPAELVGAINPLLTPEQQAAHAGAALDTMTLGLRPSSNALTTAYGEGGLRATDALLKEHPDVAVGLMVPLIALAHGAARGPGAEAIRFDTMLRDKMTRDATRETAFRALREKIASEVPDPAVRLLTNILTTVDREGKTRVRTLEEGLAEEGFMDSAQAIERIRTGAKEVLLPEEVRRETALARLQTAMERAAAEAGQREARKVVTGEPVPRPGAEVVPSNEIVGVSQAIRQALRRPAEERRPLEAGRAAPVVRGAQEPPTTPDLLQRHLAPASVREGVFPERGLTGVPVEAEFGPAGIRPLPPVRQRPPRKGRTVPAEGTLRPSGRPFVETRGASPAETARASAAAAAEEATVADRRANLVRREAVNELLRRTADVTLPADLAAALGGAIRSGNLDAITNLNRALAAAEKFGQKDAIPSIIRRAAAGAFREPPARPAKTPLQKAVEGEDAPEALTADAALSAATVRGSLEDLGKTLDEIDASVRRAGLVSERPLFNPQAAKPGAVTSLSALRAAAVARGLRVEATPDATLRLVSGDGAVQASGRDLGAIARAIESYEPPKPPPPGPPAAPAPQPLIHRRRSEAGFARTDLLGADIASSALDRANFAAREGVDALRRGARNIGALIDDTLLGTLSPSRLALALAEHVPAGSGYTEGKGVAIVGPLLRAAELNGSFKSDFLSTTSVALRQAGMRGRDKATADGIRVLNAVLAARERTPTELRTATPGASRWTGAIDASTKAADLLFDPREDLTLAQKQAAGAAWERLSPTQRRATVATAVQFAETFDRGITAAVRREFFKTLELGKSGLVPPESFRVITRDGRVLDIPTTQDIPLSKQGEIARSVEQARGEVTLVEDRPGGLARALAKPEPLPLRIGPRIGAYVSWLVLESLRDRVFNKATELARSMGISEDKLASDLYDAVSASRAAPYKGHTDPVPALRALLGPVPDAELTAFIRDSAGAIAQSKRDTTSIMQMVPLNIFTPYFQRRVSETMPEGLDLHEMLNSYANSVGRKIFLEPEINKVRPLVDSISYVPLKDAFKELLGYVGQAPVLSRSGAFIDGKLRAITSGVYKGLLLANIPIAFANMLQFAALGTPEIPTTRTGLALWMNPAAWNLALDMGITREALPFEAFQASRTRGLSVVFPALAENQRVLAAFDRLRETKSPADAARVLGQFARAGLQWTDFMAATEAIVRMQTFAMSMGATFERLGFGELARQGRLETFLETQPGRAAMEIAKNESVVNVGNINYFMGNGANTPLMLQGLARAPGVRAVRSPLMMFTSYPAGLQAMFTSNIRNLLKRDPIARRSGAEKFGRYALGLTLLAGPFAVLPLAKRIDDETVKDGSFMSAMIEWQRHYNLIGLLASAEHKAAGGAGAAPIVDPWETVGAGGVPAVGGVQSFLAGEVSLDRMVAHQTNRGAMALFSNAVSAASGQAGRVTRDRPLSPEQQRATEWFVGGFAPHFGANKPEEPLAPSVGMLVAGFGYVRRLFAAIDHQQDEIRAGVRRNAQGRPITEASLTEEIISLTLPARSASRIAERERITRSGAESKESTRLRQMFVRGLSEGDRSQIDIARRDWTRRFPGSPMFSDAAELVTMSKDEALNRLLVDEERAFRRLAKPAAVAELTRALQRRLNPDLWESLTDQERRRTEVLIQLGVQRFSAAP